MSKQSEFKGDGRQVFIIPPVICKEIAGKKLSLYRVKLGGEEKYHLEMDTDVLIRLSAWEYHILNALYSFGGDKYETLLVNTNDRFGLNLERYDIDVLLDKIANRKLFDKENAPKHPLTKPFYNGTAKIVKVAKKTANNNEKNSTSNSKPLKENIISYYERVKSDAKEIFSSDKIIANENGSQESERTADIDIEPKSVAKSVLFNPTNFLRANKSIISLGKYFLYALPLFFLASLAILSQNPQMVGYDLPNAIGGISLIGHILFGLFTVSAFVAMCTSFVAFSYTATVKSISVVYLFGFIPRFIPAIDDAEKLSREQKMWIHATPLLARIGLFSISTMLWYSSRHLGGVIAEFFAFLSFTSMLSFFVASCPFYKSNGYRFLSEFLNEPNLWGKAVTALFNKVNRNVYSPSDKNILVAYAITCVLFTFGLVAIVFIMAYHWFEVEIGKKALFIVGALVAAFVYRLSKEVKNINVEYQRNLNFERWRDGAFPTDPAELEDKEQEKPNYKKRFLLVSAAVFLILPYNYQPSGSVVMLPMQKQKISTDIAGIIDKVYYDGGEFVREGTVIAKLSVHDYQGQLDILKAQHAQKAAEIEHLKSLPTPEQVAIAEENLELAYINSRFSDQECKRQRPLHKSGGLSDSEVAVIEEQCAVDEQKVLMAEAELSNVLSGASYEEIVAAELSLMPIEAEMKMLQDKIERSHLKMPFDGKLATLELQEKTGTFLELGEPLAMAQDDKNFKAVLQVPETEMAYIKVGSKVDVKTSAYPDKKFKATVTTIEPDIEENEGSRMMRMIISFNSNEEILKSGLSGYAKVDGGTFMMWEVLTNSIIRFVTVELWAWIP
jgi:putative peptide zinc metalloprotease protein